MKKNNDAYQSVTGEEISAETIRSLAEQRIKDGTNIKKSLVPEIKFSDYVAKLEKKALIDGIGALTAIEQFAVKINKVTEIRNGLKVSLNNSRSIDLLFDGTFEKYNILGNSTGNNNPEGRRFRIAIDVVGKKSSTSSVFMERIIMLAHCANIGSIPEKFGDMEVNVMDLSADRFTCSELGLVPNFNPNYNLEIVIGSDNDAHKTAVRQIYKKTGRNVRFSANDVNMIDLAQIGSVDDINWYIDLMGYDISKGEV